MVGILVSVKSKLYQPMSGNDDLFFLLQDKSDLYVRYDNYGIYCFSYDWALNHEQRLHKVLLQRYEVVGKDARPVKSHKDAIYVYFGMRLIQVDLDEKMQTMTTSAWLRIVGLSTKIFFIKYKTINIWLREIQLI